MNRFTFTAALAALALTVSAPAFADQLAAKAGVEAGVYTDAQLVELLSAQADDNTTRINQILRAPAGAGATFSTSN